MDNQPPILDVEMNLEIMSNRIDALDADYREKISHFASLVSRLQRDMEHLITENTNLQARIIALEEKREKAAKKEFTAAMTLAEIKEAFMRGYPTKQTGEEWPDHYFVLWYSYLRGMHYKQAPDVLPSTTEVFSRAKRGIAKIYAYYELLAANNNVPANEIPNFVKRRTKMFIEYMVLNVRVPDKPVPEFWQVCSEWALTSFGHKLATWHQIANLEDKPLE